MTWVLMFTLVLSSSGAIATGAVGWATLEACETAKGKLPGWSFGVHVVAADCIEDRLPEDAY